MARDRDDGGSNSGRAASGEPKDEGDALQDDTMSRPTLAYSAGQHQEEQRMLSDKELLRAIRDGDEASLEALIERKTGPLVQLAFRILGDAEEARDIVQMTFFRLWQHRDRFDDRWSPNTWIYRICSNLAIDHLRSRRSRERQREPVRLHLRDVAGRRAERDLASLHEGEVMAIFQELSTRLTDKQRMVFLLREVEELPSKDVAEIVGCRESTVRNHLFNARKILRSALIEHYPEYAGNHSEVTP
ncbi:MAG: RNA polymerase sigma factor [Acidobacteria bacterium]|nr:MAG: RNA polymerase sigma factor [Acidobacteriota bacterium]